MVLSLIISTRSVVLVHLQVNKDWIVQGRSPATYLFAPVRQHNYVVIHKCTNLVDYFDLFFHLSLRDLRAIAIIFQEPEPGRRSFQNSATVLI